MKPELYLLTAVRNDWESLGQLLGKIDAACTGSYRLRVIVVDDASDEPRPETIFSGAPGAIETLEVLVLTRHLGHQAAMAVGLGALSRRGLGGALGVLLMDSDGEDPPEKAPELAAALAGTAAVVAARGRRDEGWKLFYGLFKQLFHYATGEKLDFGNYMFLSKEAAEALAYSPHTREHVAASLLKTGLPRVALRVDRGKRYAGKSQMSWPALFRHAVAALAVFREVVFMRALALLALYALLAVGAFRWGGEWLLWAALVLGIVFAPALLVSVLVSGILLVWGRRADWIPALEFESFVARADLVPLRRP